MDAYCFRKKLFLPYKNRRCLSGNYTNFGASVRNWKPIVYNIVKVLMRTFLELACLFTNCKKDLMHFASVATIIDYENAPCIRAQEPKNT